MKSATQYVESVRSLTDDEITNIFDVVDAASQFSTLTNIVNSDLRAWLEPHRTSLNTIWLLTQRAFFFPVHWEYWK